MNEFNQAKTIEELRTKTRFQNLKETSAIFKDKKINVEVKLYGNSIYAIIDGLIPLSVNKHNVLCSVKTVKKEVIFNFLAANDSEYLNINGAYEEADFNNLMRKLIG